MVNKEKLLANAQKFISKGQISKAVGEYQALVGAFPRDVRNRQKLAELLSRDKRDEDALKEYEAVAKHYTDTGFYLKAIAVFKQMQKIDPSRLDIYHRLAELNEKQGLIGNALSEYRNLVAHYEKQQLCEEAVEVLEKMLDLDPNNLQVPARIAEFRLVMGQTEQALAGFQELVQTHASRGEHARVIKLYDHFLDICPEEGSARLPLARALLAGGSTDKALQVLKNLVRHDPDDVEINRCLAEAYAGGGDFANARLTLGHLLKKHPDDLNLRSRMVRVCLQAGETDRALERLEEWQEQFIRDGRLEELTGFYRELKELLPGNPQVAETLADLRLELGRMADAAPAQTAEAAEAAGQEGQEQAETLELELDLDLDHHRPTEPDEEDQPVAEPMADAVDDQPVVNKEEEPTAVAEEEIELEVDLGALDELALEFEVDADPGDLAPDQAEEQAVFDAEADPDQPEDQAEAGDTVLADTGDETELDVTAEASPLADEPSLTEAEQAPVDEDLDDQLALSEEDLDPVDEALADEVLELDDDVPELVDEELELAGAELDLSGEEVGQVGDEAGLATEEFLLLEDEPEADAVGAEEVSELGDEDILEDVEELQVEDDGSALKVEAELEEVQFYLQQGLYDDAERLVQSLLEERPGLPELQAELAFIEQARQTATEQTEGDAFADLMDGLEEDDLLDATGILDSFSEGGHEDDSPSQKLVSELDSADTESHYNLGIAYKEMGLLGEAIAEFDKAGKDPARRLDCIIFTGQCHLENSDKEAALAVFKSGLTDPDLSDTGRMTLNFELGQLHRQNGEPLQALEYYQLVADQDSFFREVSEVIKALRRELGLDGTKNDDGPQGNRDRVSYV